MMLMESLKYQIPDILFIFHGSLVSISGSRLDFQILYLAELISSLLYNLISDQYNSNQVRDKQMQCESMVAKGTRRRKEL